MAALSWRVTSRSAHYSWHDLHMARENMKGVSEDCPSPERSSAVERKPFLFIFFFFIFSPPLHPRLAVKADLATTFANFLSVIRHSLSSRPFHPWKLSAHFIFCFLPLLQPLSTGPIRNILVSPDDLEMCPCPQNCVIFSEQEVIKGPNYLVITSSLVMGSLQEVRRILL